MRPPGKRPPRPPHSPPSASSAPSAATANPARTALEKIAEHFSATLTLLEDGLARPQIDRANHLELAFDLLLRGIHGELRAFAADQPASAELTELLERAEKYRRAVVPLRAHLIELAEDWICPKCGADVVAGAQIRGLTRGPMHVDLICRSCAAHAPITERGMERFQQFFGHLRSPGWNPENNGFGWDRS